MTDKEKDVYIQKLQLIIERLASSRSFNPVEGLLEVDFDELSAMPKGVVGKPVLYAVWPKWDGVER